MKRKHAKTIDLIFSRPTSGNVRFADVVALVGALGGSVDTSRSGSRVALVLFGETRVFHEPHPSPCMDKAAVDSLRNWLQSNGVTP